MPVALWRCFTGHADWPISPRTGDPSLTTCNRSPEPSARRPVEGGNRLRATPSTASRPQQKKRTIHVLQNRTSLKTRNIGLVQPVINDVSDRLRIDLHGCLPWAGSVRRRFDTTQILSG